MNEEKSIEQLVIKIQHGDVLALEELSRIWYPNVYRYALRFTGKVEAAKEVSQLTFLALTTHINSLKDPSKFIPWVFRITANNCRNIYRNQKIHEPIESAFTYKSDEKNPYQHLVQSEAINQVKEALLQIPEEQREVIILKEYEGLKFREIAQILNTSENTVKSRMYYGLSALKKTLLANKTQISTYHETF